MVRKSLFGGLLALAVIATMSFFASPADAKVRQCMIGGVPNFTSGTDGQVIDAVSWVEKGKVVTRTWTADRKSVVETRVRSPKANAPEPKKIQVSKTQQKKQPSSKVTKKNIKAAAKAPMTGTAFQPVQPLTFWSRLWHGVEWIITGEWNMKPVIPTVIKPVPATTQVVPPKTKLKKRVIYKRGPPKKKSCEQGIKVMKYVPTAPQSPLKTLAAPPCPPASIQKPATGQATNEKPTGKLANWEVRFATYWINEKGQRKLVREYLRSSAEEPYDRRSPDYCEKPRKGIVVYEERYDQHTYVKTSEKPVAPGTVVHFALTPKPDKLDLDHIVRDIDKDNFEIYHSESGRFIPVEKPKALQIAYPDEYHKFYKEVRVSPTEQPKVFVEMYENAEKGSG